MEAEDISEVETNPMNASTNPRKRLAKANEVSEVLQPNKMNVSLDLPFSKERLREKHLDHPQRHPRNTDLEV